MLVTRKNLAGLIFLLAATSIQAQETRNDTPAADKLRSAADVPASGYPETPEGMKAQLWVAFEAYRSGDEQRYSALLDGFGLPNLEVWLRDAVGPRKAPQLAIEYPNRFSRFKASLTSSFLYGRDGEDPELRVEQLEVQNSTSPSVSVTPAFMARIESFKISMYPRKGGLGRREWASTFVYDSGAFRYLGDGAFHFWEQARLVVGDVPSRIRVGGNVQAAQIIHMVQPEYPGKAKKKHIQGTVVLHAIVAKDGTIQDLQYVSGPEELMKPAMDAVRQWRYKPVLLSGRPVEVDTTIAVNFVLDH